MKSPISTEEVFVNKIMDNEILLYLDEDPVPYCIKRRYLENLLVEDRVYDDEMTYYDLGKLFLNGGPSILLDTVDALQDQECRTFRIVKKMEIKTVESYIHKRIREYVEEEGYGTSYIPKKWQALRDFCNDGYSDINRYLIRLTNYHPGSGALELIIQSFKWIFGIQDPPRPIRKYKDDPEIRSMVDDIDHLFYKYAKKSKKPKNLYRGMNTFYTYLNKPGDKMVIENYMSCFDDGGGLPGPANIWCMITLEPGVPFLETYNNKEFREFVEYPGEREVILPRNLVATYIGDCVPEPGMYIHKHISLSFLQISGERELYSLDRM
jgi:hypothetical protein